MSNPTADNSLNRAFRVLKRQHNRLSVENLELQNRIHRLEQRLLSLDPCFEPPSINHLRVIDTTQYMSFHTDLDIDSLLAPLDPASLAPATNIPMMTPRPIDNTALLTLPNFTGYNEDL